MNIPTKQMALLVRVYEQPDGMLGRERLAADIWPNVGRSNALHSLSQAIYSLKRSATESVVVADHETVGVGDFSCDLREFRTAVSQQAIGVAASLYRGDLASGLEVPQAVRYAHWLDSARASARRSAIDIAEKLRQSLRWDDLLPLTSTLTTVGGLVEREVLSLHADALKAVHGDAAVSEFVSTLPGEILEDREVWEDGLERRGPTRHFFGRVEALESLVAHFDSSGSSDPRLVLIQGEAGIGKSVLASRFARLLAIRGSFVLSAVGHAAEVNLPLGVVEQWLMEATDRNPPLGTTDPWDAVVTDLFPTLRDTPTGSRPASLAPGEVGYQRLVESIRLYLMARASGRRIALFVDDLQLADSASIDLVHYFFTRKREGPSFLVATVRSEFRQAVSQVLDWEFTHEVSLDGLEQHEIAEWLLKLSIGRPGLEEAAESLRNRTGGNPLLVSALIEEGQVRSPTAMPPDSIVDFFRPRVGGCSVEARRMLGAVAITGQPVRLGEVGEIAGLGETQAASAFKELEQAHIASETGDGRVQLRHSLLGEVALSLLSPAEEQALHGRVARVLSERGERLPVLAAPSFDAAGNRGAAHEAAVRAAEACETLHARNEKEFFLKIALSNARTPLEQARTRLSLADLAIRQGNFHHALEWLSSASNEEAWPDGTAHQAEILAVRAQAAMMADANHLSELWDKAESLRGTVDTRLIAEALASLAGMSHDLGFDSKSLAIAEQILSDLSRLPRDLQTARSLLRSMAIVGVYRGYDQALETIATFPDPAQLGMEDPAYETSYYSTRASLLVAAGKLGRAEEDFARSLGIAERYGLYDHYFGIHNNLGVCLMDQGRLTEARAHFATAEEYSNPTVSPGFYWIVNDNQMILEYELKAYDRAIEMAETRLQSPNSVTARATLSALGILGLSSLERGALARCREAEREIRAIESHSRPTGNDMSYVEIFVARMAALRNDKAEARHRLRSATALYRSRNAMAFARVAVELCRLLDRGDDDRVALLEELADLLGADVGGKLLMELEILAP